MTVLYGIFLFLFVLLCVILCISILMQESKSTGLGASFGGDSGDSLFGTSTPEVLKKFTAWASAVFLISCVILSMWTQTLGRSRANTNSSIERIER